MRVGTCLAVTLCSMIMVSAGCIAGELKHRYHGVHMVLPYRGTDSVAVGTWDQRPYILAHDKSPNFVGLRIRPAFRGLLAQLPS
jgi:hypothetical protein